MEALFSAWVSYPDLRLGQLISNATSAESCPLFYLEDFQLTEALEKFGRDHP